MSDSVDARVDLAGIPLRNPVLTASGTFGYGTELAPFLEFLLAIPEDVPGNQATGHVGVGALAWQGREAAEAAEGEERADRAEA